MAFGVWCSYIIESLENHYNSESTSPLENGHYLYETLNVRDEVLTSFMLDRPI